MEKKFLVCRYVQQGEEITYSPRQYGYYVSTDKKISSGDFVCLLSGKEREVQQTIVVCKVDAVYQANETNCEVIDDLSSKCAQVKDKVYLGKANIKDFFAEIDREIKVKEITKELEKRFKEAEKMMLYKQLAQSDEVMKELLQKLEAVQAGSLTDEKEEE